VSDFDVLEARLKPNRSGALKKIGDRILALEQQRIWFVAIGVLGAALMGISKAVSGTPGIVLVFVGAALAAVGGLFVARFDYRKLELTSFLQEAESVAEAAIETGRAAQQKLSKLTDEGQALERRRLALIDANAVMRETLEQALLVPESTLTSAIDSMLETALPHLLVSVDFGQEETWAISVFEVQGDELVRIVAKRARRADEQKPSRRWRKNQGFVGAAWSREDAVVVSDGQDGVTAEEMKVPIELAKPYDNERYRSAAAIPVRIGDPATIWGVVAVSTDRVGRFRRTPQGDRQEQAVDTVRLIARMTALSVAAFRRGER
jgi:hypothetical protein